MSQLSAFKKVQSKFQGYFYDDSAALWDALLEFQTTQSIKGHMMEIGVFKGRSALMSSLHLRNDEKFLLVDIEYMDEARSNLDPFLGHRACFLKKHSHDLQDSDLTGFRHACRWVHIDGDHTGEAVMNDIALGETLLSPDGVLILDDFYNPMFPQLTEAVYSYLATNKYKLSMFLCGWNKAYLTRPTYARFYRKMIQQHLAKALHEREIHEFTIHKSAPLDECTAFGVSGRFMDRDYCGVVTDANDLPV